ncbi:GLPGLI family protein [Aquimarina megaterium]|uniref:GLPGLI family protein n=1 Tax=Aquimarina megaterium TaxID=1443666 RepID=UPI000945DE09|nr:GLPGLI family protein [Aquimarina megaterium]
MNHLIFITFLIFNYTVNSQKETIGIVEYQNIVNNENGVSFTSPYKLYFNSTISLYRKEGDGKQINNEKSKEEEIGEGTTISEHKVMKSGLPQPYYYTNSKTNELVFRESIIGKLYVVSDSIESIPWQLHAEHKKIGAYSCQKAMAKYRGREYTVWFTSEIPISHGPWKLRGLPGLILEVTEETGKFEFRAIKINLQPDKNVIQDKLNKPSISKIVGMKTYIKALKNKYEETMAKAMASLPRGAKLMTDCDVCPDPKNNSLERFE